MQSWFRQGAHLQQSTSSIFEKESGWLTHLHCTQLTVNNLAKKKKKKNHNNVSFLLFFLSAKSSVKVTSCGQLLDQMCSCPNSGLDVCSRSSNAVFLQKLKKRPCLENISLGRLFTQVKSLSPSVRCVQWCRTVTSARLLPFWAEMKGSIKFPRRTTASITALGCIVGGSVESTRVSVGRMWEEEKSCINHKI